MSRLAWYVEVREVCQGKKGLSRLERSVKVREICQD